ncbi:MAG TPA: carboxypeptidase-like regulatory domain-containing protein [Candidatus Acidoferrum sp.]|nr:carboxypeptidase-like regulatory domain-containing protein [Candidatus Acidoferrum sp.]
MGTALLAPLLIMLAMFLSCASAASQYSVEMVEPFHSRSLSGTVLDASAAPLEGAVVERCQERWRNCFDRVVTDRHGRFSWHHAKNGTYFLKLSKDGFNPMQVTVIIDGNFKAGLRFQLPIAN